MILRAYSIQDKKTGAFSPPFFTTYEADAIRMVQGLLEGTENTVSKYPEDFYLYRIGSFDDLVGTFENYPEQICPVVTLLRKRESVIDGGEKSEFEMT